MMIDSERNLFVYLKGEKFRGMKFRGFRGFFREMFRGNFLDPRK